MAMSKGTPTDWLLASRSSGDICGPYWASICLRRSLCHRAARLGLFVKGGLGLVLAVLIDMVVSACASLISTLVTAASGGAAAGEALDSKVLLLFFVDEQAASLRSSLPQFRAADIDIVVGADGAKAAAHKASRWLVAAPTAREPMIDSRRGRRRRRPKSGVMLKKTMPKNGVAKRNAEVKNAPKRNIRNALAHRMISTTSLGGSAALGGPQKDTGCQYSSSCSSSQPTCFLRHHCAP